VVPGDVVTLYLTKAASSQYGITVGINLGIAAAPASSAGVFGLLLLD